MYVLNGRLVEDEHYVAVVKLIKVLYRLEIVTKDEALEIALEFRPLYV